MSQCKRIWEVEAARDGQLTGVDQTSIERHIASCPECSMEARRLEELAVRLRALPVAPVSELSFRRQRQELLARAFVERSGAGPRPRFALRAAIGALLACAGLFLGSSLLSTEEPLATLTVQSTADAHYTRTGTAEGELIQLSAGRITLHIQPGARPKRVLLRTPDGEIEDVGTVFTVAVVGERTESISVAEGRVVARIAGKPARWIAAGETLRPYAGKTDVSAAIRERATDATLTEGARPARRTSASAAELQLASGQAAAPSARSDPPAHIAPRAPSPALSSKRHVEEQRKEASTDPPKASATDLFTWAMTHIEARDEARAAELLGELVQNYPADAHAEDATYLRVVVLMRLGKVDAARAAGHVYLARYPSGFRALDVEKLLQRATPPSP